MKTIEKISKIATIVTASISISYLFVKLLLHGNSNNFILLYIGFLIEITVIDIVLLSIIVIIFYKSEYILSYIKTTFKQVNRELSKNKIHKTIYILNISITASLTLFVLVLYARQRYFAYKNLNKGFEYRIVKMANENIISGDYLDAIDLYNKYLVFNPKIKENYFLQHYIEELESRMLISNLWYYRSMNENKIFPGFTRESYFQLLQSVKLYPKNISTNEELNKREILLRNLKDIPSKIYDACQVNNDKLIIDLYNQYGWYLFDEELNRILKLKYFQNGKNPHIIKDLVLKKTKTRFTEDIEESWLLKKNVLVNFPN